MRQFRNVLIFNKQRKRRGYFCLTISLFVGTNYYVVCDLPLFNRYAFWLNIAFFDVSFVLQGLRPFCGSVSLFSYGFSLGMIWGVFFVNLWRYFRS